MLRSTLSITVFCVATLLVGCHKEISAGYADTITPANPMRPTPNVAHSTEDDALRCNKLANCEIETVFPGATLKPSPEKGCQSISVVGRGPAQRPDDVDLETRAKVWVALIVPAQGGVAKAARVVGSNDVRFEAAAYEVARSLVFTPKRCRGIGYDQYIISPIFFGPRPVPAPLP
jgi:hypothetical protein